MKRRREMIRGRYLLKTATGLMLLLFIVSAPCFGVQKNKDNSSRETMIISGHPNYPPFMWKQGETIKGAGVDLIKLICNELEIPFEIKWGGPWQRVQTLAKSGSLDFIVGIYSNEDRKKFLDYTVPYMPDPTSITVLKDKTFEYKERVDLIGKIGVTIHGDSFGQDLDDFIKTKLNVKRAYTVDAIFKNLIAGRVEYVLWGYYPTIINGSEEGVFDKIRILEPPVVTENMYMAFSKKSPFKKYLQEVNTVIERYKADGTIAMIVERNLSIYNAKRKN